MKLQKLLPQLIRAALDQDQQQVRRTAMSIVREIRAEEPAVAKEIAEAMAYGDISQRASRSVGINPTPSDSENHSPLALVQEPTPVPEPVLSPTERVALQEFLDERSHLQSLLSSGLEPSKSLLVTGPPGVGKTHLITHIASVLKLPLVTLDLSTAISSYLGRTGFNLRKVIDYGQSMPSVLFLDEFDAVAKRRDDPTDLGELKRIVNVLLLELDRWPAHSIIAAATNHPDLLDPAVWRRFDLVLEISLPGERERTDLLEMYLPEGLVPKDLVRAVASFTDGLSGAGIRQLCGKVVRKNLIHGERPESCLLSEVGLRCAESWGKATRERFCGCIKDALGDSVSSRQLGKWIGLSHTTVQRYLRD